jgi:hypothetical protein
MQFIEGSKKRATSELPGTGNESRWEKKDRAPKEAYEPLELQLTQSDIVVGVVVAG